MIIVALCLVALVGMVVLVVDVGGLLLNRRAMVNASDAGALAAAQACAVPSSQTPEVAADSLAADNSSAADITPTNIVPPTNGCGSQPSGYVTVRYGANQQLFFAGIFRQGQGHVTTQATAIWGPPGAANPLPLVVYSNAFNTCKLQEQQTPGSLCYIWEDNSNTDGSQNGFGFLDLNIDSSSPRQYGWNTMNPNAKCKNPGSDIKNWIDNYPDPKVGDLPLNYPNPTYVCLASGGKSSAFGNDVQKDGPLYDLRDNGQGAPIVFLPINRCDPTTTGPATYGQLGSSGTPVPCNQTPAQYDIIGFVAITLEAIYTPKEAQGGGGTCVSDVTINQGTNETVPFSITGFGNSSCPTAMPDGVSPLPTITTVNSGKGAGPAPVQCTTAPLSIPANCDYFYSNGTITWYRSGNAKEGQNFRISFGWQTAGPCGVAPDKLNNSGHCLAVKIVKVQIGGSGPGHGDPSSNIRAVKLCDPIGVPGSCAPISVPNP